MGVDVGLGSKVSIYRERGCVKQIVVNGMSLMFEPCVYISPNKEGAQAEIPQLYAGESLMTALASPLSAN